MALDWPGPADRTRSYRGNPNGEFEIADVAWDGTGATGIRTTPGEARPVGGRVPDRHHRREARTEPARGAVDGAFDDSHYGLGIMITPDNVLWHGGEAGGFHSIFGISADRETAVAVTCNSISIEPYDIAGPLIEIWDPS